MRAVADALCHTLQSRHGYDHRVSVHGYTMRVRELLSAADGFVTTTAGCLRRPVGSYQVLPAAADITVKLARRPAEMGV